MVYPWYLHDRKAEGFGGRRLTGNRRRILKINRGNHCNIPRGGIRSFIQRPYIFPFTANRSP